MGYKYMFGTYLMKQLGSTLVYARIETVNT